MTQTFFEMILKIFTFNTLTVLPSLLIFIIGTITFVYNKILSNNIRRGILICGAVFFSIISIFSQNYIITFISLETLSGICFLLVILSRNIKRKVAISYFIIHSFAGILMLIAIMMNFYENDTFQITKSSGAISAKETIMLFSLIINTALFPFFNWYTRTYSRADSFSLIILSAITTKTSFFILWKIIPGSSILFDVGLITMLCSMLLALITKNVVKFLLLISIASTGFATMSVSYHGFLITEGISNEINFQLVFYIASSSFSVAGFLALYGFITNNECENNSFSSIKNYFQEYGSSVHFVIPAIIFGLCFASFPFTASFIAKTNITKFFVDETLIYIILKSSGVLFLMFAIKLISPVFHSVEFFKLDKRGKKLVGVLYAFSFALIVLNVISLFIVKVKFSLFIISVEFFTFIAYTLMAGALLMILDFMLKVTNARYLIEITLHDLRALKIKTFFVLRKIKSKLHVIFDYMFHKKRELKRILAFSLISPSLGIISTILLLLLLAN